jgi:hypothetical protein
MVFRSIFSYWSNTTDTPYIQSKLNMFFYINIRIFKIKLNNYISFAITSLNSLKYKQIKIYYNILSFEFLYFKFLMFSVLFYIILIVI